MSVDLDRDLVISRVIRASRETVWRAWSDPHMFARWWVPEPAQCAVVTMDLVPGGGLVTQISENGGPFVEHMNACFLDVQVARRIVFTNALTAGWRPAPTAFMTAVISLEDHADGTSYQAHVMHCSPEDRGLHEDLGFHDGWGTVAGQLARLVESV